MQRHPRPTRPLRRDRSGAPAARAALAGLGAALALGVASPAAAHQHDPAASGHPLRILAYVVHPVGVVIDTLIFRPAHWLGHHEPFRTLFGHDH